MKKILLVTRPIAPPWDEASKNFAYYLAKNMTGVEMHIMTKGLLPDLPENIIQHPIYTASENDFAFSQKVRSLFFQWRNKKAFDVTHHFFTPAKLNSFFLRHFLNSKHTKTIQTVATLREDLRSDAEIGKMMFGNLIITYSDYAAHKLERLGFQNVKRVSPGIDLEKYQPREKNLELLRKCGFSAEDFIINFTGEYTRLGAMDNVIDSFIEIAKKIPNAKLSLAVRVKNEKDAAKKKEVVEKLKTNSLLEKVSFFDNSFVCGENFDMSEAYNLCDISLFPVQNMRGKFDIPLAVVEAMACAKPVILSDLPILAELGNQNNSVIIKAGDVPGIAAAILYLYNHPEKRALIGSAAQKFVAERFDIRKVAETYEKIYEKI